MSNFWSANGDHNATNTSDKTVLLLIGGATVRPGLFEWWLSNVSTPDDKVMDWSLKIATNTTNNAGTSVTIIAHNGAPSAIVTAKDRITTEPDVYQGASWKQAVHWRVTVRQFLNPGKEIYVPATANYGLGMLANAPSGSPNPYCDMWFVQ